MSINHVQAHVIFNRESAFRGENVFIPVQITE